MINLSEMTPIGKSLSGASPALEAVPTNGMPRSLAHFVDDEARAYRAQGTPEAAFLADQLGRIAQLVRWTNATNAQDYIERLDVWEQDIREREYARGFQAGSKAGKRGL